MNLDKANRVLELLRQITSDVVQENNTNLSDEHLELQAHLVLSIEKEAGNLKKELIKAQIMSNIPNKKIAIFFDMTQARISQLKAEILKESRRNFPTYKHTTGLDLRRIVEENSRKLLEAAKK